MTADEENNFESFVFGVYETRSLVKYGDPRLTGYRRQGERRAKKAYLAIKKKKINRIYLTSQSDRKHLLSPNPFDKTEIDIDSRFWPKALL